MSSLSTASSAKVFKSLDVLDWHERVYCNRKSSTSSLVEAIACDDETHERAGREGVAAAARAARLDASSIYSNNNLVLVGTCCHPLPHIQATPDPFHPA
jgi:hypothetical protein